MSFFRGRWKLEGRHVHLRIFVSRSRSTTYALTGELVMRLDEFDSFRNDVINPATEQWQFVDDTPKEDDDAPAY